MEKLYKYLNKIGVEEKPRRGNYTPAPAEYYRQTYGDGYFYNAPNHTHAGARRAFLTFTDYTPGEITLQYCQIYKGGSNYGRREESERLLNKYNQLACILYGAITAGLLETAEQPQPVTA